MVAQLEHQFRLGRLSLQGLWFYCQVQICLSWVHANIFQRLSNGYLNDIFQPMMRPMQALSTVIQKASVSNICGSAVLNLLQSQVTKFPCNSYHSVSWVSFLSSKFSLLWPLLYLGKGYGWGQCCAVDAGENDTMCK